MLTDSGHDFWCLSSRKTHPQWSEGLVYTIWTLTVLLLPSDEVAFIGVKYNSHFGFMLSYTSKPEKIQWCWDENDSQKTMEEKVLEKTGDSVGRKSGVSGKHYEGFCLKENKHWTALVIFKYSLKSYEPWSKPIKGSDSHYWTVGGELLLMLEINYCLSPNNTVVLQSATWKATSSTGWTVSLFKLFICRGWVLCSALGAEGQALVLCCDPRSCKTLNLLWNYFCLSGSLVMWMCRTLLFCLSDSCLEVNLCVQINRDLWAASTCCICHQVNCGKWPIFVGVLLWLFLSPVIERAASVAVLSREEEPAAEISSIGDTGRR